MVYKFVVLSDEDESFVREFEFLDTHTLIDFHNLIQDELEFDKSQTGFIFYGYRQLGKGRGIYSL